MITVRISSKGQIAIPKPIREKIGLEEGSELAIEIDGPNLVFRKVPVKSWRRWRGVLKGSNALQDHEKEHMEEIKQDEKNF